VRERRKQLLGGVKERRKQVLAPCSSS
jgi:hypothetical protein